MNNYNLWKPYNTNSIPTRSMRPEKTCAQHIYIYKVLYTNVEKLVLGLNLHFWTAEEKQSGNYDPVVFDFIVRGSYVRRIRAKNHMYFTFHR